MPEHVSENTSARFEKKEETNGETNQSVYMKKNRFRNIVIFEKINGRVYLGMVGVFGLFERLVPLLNNISNNLCGCSVALSLKRKKNNNMQTTK